MQNPMRIQTEQDMMEFCQQAKGSFNIRIKTNVSPLDELEWKKKIQR